MMFRESNCINVHNGIHKYSQNVCNFWASQFWHLFAPSTVPKLFQIQLYPIQLSFRAHIYLSILTTVAKVFLPLWDYKIFLPAWVKNRMWTKYLMLYIITLKIYCLSLNMCRVKVKVSFLSKICSLEVSFFCNLK